MFMGLSPDHASTGPLVLNLDTGTITPQFHVVFDDWFITATTSIDDLPDIDSPAWSKCLETVSANSSGMKMTMRLTLKTS